MASRAEEGRRAIEAVLFDMDGVLVDSEPFIAEAAAAMFAERHGTVVDVRDFAPFVGTGEGRYLGGVAEKYGVELDLSSDKERTYAIYATIVRGRIAELPGAKAFVCACRERGLKTALATSADMIKMEANFREIGFVESDFDATVNGLDVERKKPFPDIYLEAARRLGVAPERCLVVEDALSGIKAAKAAGCLCLGIASSLGEAELRRAGADFAAPDLARADRSILGRR
jgi:beta-phosphoglucomutase